MSKVSESGIIERKVVLTPTQLTYTVFLHVFAYARKIDLERHMDLFQDIFPSYTRHFQQLRRLERPGNTSIQEMVRREILTLRKE